MNELKRTQDWQRTVLTGREFLAKLNNKKFPNGDTLGIDLITEEYNELLDAVKKDKRVDILDALGDLMVVIVGKIDSMGVDANKLLKLINDSNYSKFCDNDVIGYHTVEKYKQICTKIKLFETPVKTNRTNKTKYLAYRESDYKLLKSIKYKTPKIDEL